jgi:hypothetical protein
MRRILFLCTILLTVALSRPAFSETQNDGWERVVALPPGQKIDIYTGTKHQRCKLVSVDDRQVSCERSKKNSSTISRTEITKVRLPYTGTFTIVGFVAGTALGAGIGAVATKPANPNELFGGIGEAIGALAGGVIGAIGGTATGFIVDKVRQKTLYLAP